MAEKEKKWTRESIDDWIDCTIDDVETILEELKENGEEGEFPCPHSGKTLTSGEIIDHLDVWTREWMYEKHGILEKENLDEAYERSMRGI